MITAMYRRQEFFRCSYFVYNNYKDPALYVSSEDVFVDQVVRSILVDKPRVRLNDIVWDYSKSATIVHENLSRIAKPKPFKSKKATQKVKKPIGKKRVKKTA